MGNAMDISSQSTGNGSFVLIRQINMQHCKTAAAHLSQQLTTLRQTYIYLLQEPYLYRGKIPGIPGGIANSHIPGNDSRTAIVCSRNLNLWFCPQFSDRDLTVCYWKGPLDGGGDIYLASAYMDIMATGVVSAKLQGLVAHCEVTKTKLIICADTNSHSTLWGSTEANRRGEKLEEFIFQNNLHVHNIGNLPTFVIVDLPLLSMLHSQKE